MSSEQPGNPLAQTMLAPTPGPFLAPSKWVIVADRKFIAGGLWSQPTWVQVLTLLHTNHVILHFNTVPC